MSALRDNDMYTEDVKQYAHRAFDNPRLLMPCRTPLWHVLMNGNATQRVRAVERLLREVLAEERGGPGTEEVRRQGDAPPGPPPPPPRKPRKPTGQRLSVGGLRQVPQTGYWGEQALSDLACAEEVRETAPQRTQRFLESAAVHALLEVGGAVDRLVQEHTRQGNEGMQRVARVGF